MPDFFKKKWAESLCCFLLPLSIGFGLDILLLMMLTLVQPSLDFAWLRTFEEFAVHLRIRVHQFSDLALWPLLPILGVLLMLTLWIPNWKLVSRFLSLQQCAFSLFVALMALTTFSFFAREPLQQRAIKNQEVIIREYQVNLRKEWDSVGKYLAAKTITTNAQQLETSDQQQLADFALAIAKVASRAPNWPVPGSKRTLRRLSYYAIDIKSAIAQAMARYYVQSAISQPDVQALVRHSEAHKPPLPEEKALLTIPATVDELRSRRRVVDGERSKAEDVAKQAEEAKKAAIAGLLGRLAPEMAGVLGDYIGCAVDVLADFFSPLIEKWSLAAGRHIPVSELFQRLEASTIGVSRMIRELLTPASWTNSQSLAGEGTPMETEVEKIARETLPTELDRQSSAKDAKSGNRGFPRGEDKNGVKDIIEQRMREVTRKARAAER